MNFIILSKVVEELSAILPGAAVERLFESDGIFYFVLRKGRDGLTLLFSPDRGLPRVHLATKRPEASQPASLFCQYLRSRLTGSRISAIGLVNNDRVMEILFSGIDGDYRVVFEVFGSRPNIFVLDESFRILSALHTVALVRDGGRVLMPGSVYEPPPRPQRPDDSKRPDMPLPRSIHEPVFPINRGVEIFYERCMREQAADRLRKRLVSSVGKALAKIGRRIEALKKDMGQADRAEEYRLYGEIILAGLGDIPRSAVSVQLSDFSGEMRTIPLLPGVSAARNADLYFKRYKKAKAGAGMITKRLAAAMEEEARLRSILDELNRVDDMPGLERIAARLSLIGRVDQNRGKARTKGKKDAISGVRKIVHNGWEIVVGRNAAANDYICTRLARPDDLWFHADGMPGSHVLVRNPNRSAIPQDVIEKAAGLAAYFSKGRGSTKVSVMYTRAAYVRKPKAAGPGTVSVFVHKTILTVPDAPHNVS